MEPLTRAFNAMVGVLLCLLICSSSRADTPREIAAKVSPSVVLLVMEDANGQPLAMGSGFVIKEGVIATNLHVIDGASRGYVKLANSKAKYDIKGTLAIDSMRDLALLAVDQVIGSLAWTNEQIFGEAEHPGASPLALNSRARFV